MKIAHISDLHYGRSNENDQRIDALINGISHFGVDHLAITGDLTAYGTPDQYKMIISILQKYGFFSAERLTVIPGNHDLFNYLLGYFHTAWDILKRLDRLPAAIYQSVKFNIYRYNEELRRFYDFFYSIFTNSIRVDNQAAPFPLAKHLNNETVLITIDSNSAIGVRENKAASNGKVHLKSLESLLQDNRIAEKRKIIMMHHYLHHENDIIDTHGKGYSRFMKLNNRDEIAQLLIDHNVDLVLHGHKHTNAEYWIDGDMLRVLNGGGTYNGPYWNLIELSPDDINIEIRKCNRLTAVATEIATN